MRHVGRTRVVIGAGTFLLGVAVVPLMSGPAAATTKATSHRTGTVVASSTETPSVRPAGLSPPAGYVVEEEGYSAPNAEQTQGSVACPTGTVPWGGGAFISSTSLAANLNSSFPFGTDWAAKVNNASGSAVGFSVYAVCADQPADYTVQNSGSVPNLAGSQTFDQVSCPKKTVALGGGTYSSSSATSVNINGTYPDVTGKTYYWNVNMNNASGSTNEVQAIAVCGKKPKGFRLVQSADVDNPPGAQSGVVAACHHAVAVGGGLVTLSAHTNVDLSTSEPDFTEWVGYENNGSDADDSIVAFVECAR
jgi:hypothetical protein